MGVVVPVIVLTAWEAAVWLGLLSARYFPPPSELDRSAYADRLLAHVAGITGLAASLPARPW